MGMMSLLLPPDLGAEALEALDRAYLVAGSDYMPWPTDVRRANGKLTIRRSVDESGYLCVPWDVPPLGRLMISTATLIERPEPYLLPIELARGKVNQLRTQAADWQMGGLRMPEQLAERVRSTGRTFAHAVTIQERPAEAAPIAGQALAEAVEIGEELVRVYMDQVFEVRHQRQAQLTTRLSCRVGPAVPDAEQTRLLRQSFNAVRIAFPWSEIEPSESAYRWNAGDALVRWAKDQGFAIIGGPIVDFSRRQLPDWLWLWERDIRALAKFFSEYVAAVVRHYHSDIKTWQVTAASNSASILSLEEEELVGLTLKLLDTARQVDNGLQLVVGISQPWGEYRAVDDRSHSPFEFADNLLRSGLNIAAFDLEIVAGVWPRGSYRRDLLEVSRLLDLYALLGHPLHVSLGCPSASRPDALADPEYRFAEDAAPGWTPESQADWTERIAGLALCKPFVFGVDWIHWNDAGPHSFPNSGLLDGSGVPKPALEHLHRFRGRHLQ